jgi:hypothetical protein
MIANIKPLQEKNCHSSEYELAITCVAKATGSRIYGKPVRPYTPIRRRKHANYY